MDCLQTLFKTKDTLILVGGSGLYADALLEGLDDFPEVDPAFRYQLNKQLQEEGIEALVALLKTVDPVYHQKVDLGNPHRLIRALEVCLSSGQHYSSFLGNKKALPSLKHRRSSSNGIVQSYTTASTCGSIRWSLRV